MDEGSETLSDSSSASYPVPDRPLALAEEPRRLCAELGFVATECAKHSLGPIWDDDGVWVSAPGCSGGAAGPITGCPCCPANWGNICAADAQPCASTPAAPCKSNSDLVVVPTRAHGEIQPRKLFEETSEN